MKILLNTQKLTTFTPTIVFILFIAFSVILSVSIWLRAVVLIDIPYRFVSIVPYVAIFFALPIISLFYIIDVIDKNKKGKNRNFLLIYLTFIVFLYVTLSIIAVKFPLFYIIPEYYLFWAPVLLMLLIYSRLNFTNKFKKYKWLVVSVLIVVLILPNITVVLATNTILNGAASISNSSERASYICKRVEFMNCFSSSFRANNDYWKFMLTGVGNCGEMAMAKKQLLINAGFDSRKVTVSGENHEFAEVNIDGLWMVADGDTIVSRSELTHNRINCIGSLTYVCTITDNSFIELTQDYTNNTDTVIIRVTRNGEPVSGANVHLKHIFEMFSGGILQTLPSTDRSFVTDFNGTVALHLGKPNYIGEFEKSEPYYWVFVNGVNQSLTITSKGLGIIQPITEIPIN